MFGGTRSLGCADATGGGIVLAFATALSLVEDLSHPGALPLRSITADLIGLTVFCFSSWLSLRQWRWLALGAYIVLVLIYLAFLHRDPQPRSLLRNPGPYRSWRGSAHAVGNVVAG